VAGAADYSCDAAGASHSLDRTFFAGALKWSNHQVADRLVTYALRGEVLEVRHGQASSCANIHRWPIKPSSWG